MQKKKRVGMIAFLVLCICAFSMVVFASEEIAEESNQLETIAETSEGQSETIEESVSEENNAEIEDSYVYDGEDFFAENENGARAAVKGKIDYTYWAIHKGAGFGDILEDGRDLDHLGCIMLKVGSGWKTAYCVHHNADLKGGHEYADTASYLTESNKKRLTGMALYNGFRFGSWNPDKGTVPSDADKGKYTATQTMVWLIERGWYTYDSDTYAFQLNTKAVDVAKKICNKSDQSPAGSAYQYFQDLYRKMQGYGINPSFTARNETGAQLKNLGYDFDAQQYVLKLTDTNSVLSQYTVQDLPNGVTTKKEGNTLTFYSSAPITSPIAIKLSKKIFKAESAVTVWSDQTVIGYQQIGTYREPEPMTIDAYIKITAQSVTMTAEKIWDDSDNLYVRRPKEVLVDLYRGKNKGDRAVLVQTVALNEENNWQSSVTDLPQKDATGGHIYYMFSEREISGYQSSGEENKVEDRHWKFSFTNTLKKGNLQLIKQSMEAQITSGNGCYSLKNAKYGLYTDSACSNNVGILTTDDTGKSNVLTGLATGTYYVKEIERPLGYRLDQTVHEVTIKEGDTTIITLADVPLLSKGNLQIEKVSSDGATVDEKFPLAGAEFTIDYYAEMGLTKETISTKKPLRSWVIRVKKMLVGEKALYMAQLLDDDLIAEKSAPLFKNSDGETVIPLGTLAIRESKPAKAYKLAGYVENSEGKRISDHPEEAVIVSIIDDEENVRFQDAMGLTYGNLMLRVANELYKCRIQINKVSSNSMSLENVQLALYDENGNKRMSGQTNKEGKIVFSEIEPGRYWLREEKTVNGQQLLKEPIEVTLPVILTAQEVEKKKLDPSSLVYDEDENVFRLYDLTFEITNSGNLVLPMTGGNGKNYVDVLFIAAIVMVTGGIYLKKRTKRRQSNF